MSDLLEAIEALSFDDDNIDIGEVKSDESLYLIKSQELSIELEEDCLCDSPSSRLESACDDLLNPLENLIRPVELHTDLPVRVYCISDLHADNKLCMDWVKNKCFPNAAPSESTTQNATDGYLNILVIPGDVATSIKVLRDVFRLLLERFSVVCYCFGNHEAWIVSNPNPNPGPGSPAKMDRVHLSKVGQVDGGGETDITNVTGVVAAVPDLEATHDSRSRMLLRTNVIE